MSDRCPSCGSDDRNVCEFIMDADFTQAGPGADVCTHRWHTQETDPRCPTCGRKDSARYNPDLAVGARLNTACPDLFHTVQPTQETDPE